MQNLEGANKRTWKRFLIRPRRQFMLVMASLAVGIMVSALLLGYLVVTVGNVISVLDDSQPDAAIFVRRVVSPVLDQMIGCQIILWITSFVVGILISHRIYGPIVPIVRHIKSLKSGDYASRVRLRNGDDFEEVASALNELAEELSGKAAEPKT